MDEHGESFTCALIDRKKNPDCELILTSLCAIYEFFLHRFA